MINFNDILNNFKNEFANNLISKGINASGNLANSMRFETDINGSGYVITITLPEYAKYVNDGTKPHFPPIQEIKKWIKIKPVLPRAINGKLPTENQLSFLIARKISKVGTKQTHIIEDTINEFDLIGKLYSRLSEDIKEEVTEILNKELTQV